MMNDGLQIVEQFAMALDNEDYAVAKSLLDSACKYSCRGKRYVGPTEIIASYENNGATAKSFDVVDYESEVFAEPDGSFRIRFTDHLAHGDHQCTFQCDQLTQINDQGKIIRIEHLDLPGQTEALAEFRMKCRTNSDRDRNDGP